MDFVQFWQIIEKSRQGNRYNLFKQEESIEQSLQTLSPEEIIGFSGVISELILRTYRWDLWDAAYLIKGGCSDEGFLLFRLWLIAQGEQVYSEATINPDSLADYLKPRDGACEFSALRSLPGKVWSERTGLPRSEFSAEDTEADGEPSGEHLTEDAPEIALRFPKLFRKYA